MLCRYFLYNKGVVNGEGGGWDTLQKLFGSRGEERKNGCLQHYRYRRIIIVGGQRFLFKTKQKLKFKRPKCTEYYLSNAICESVCGGGGCRMDPLVEGGREAIVL